MSQSTASPEHPRPPHSMPSHKTQPPSPSPRPREHTSAAPVSSVPQPPTVTNPTTTSSPTPPSNYNLLPPTHTTISHRLSQSIQRLLHTLREDPLEGMERSRPIAAESQVTPWAAQRSAEVLASLERAWTAAFQAGELLRRSAWAVEPTAWDGGGEGEVGVGHGDTGGHTVKSAGIGNDRVSVETGRREVGGANIEMGGVLGAYGSGVHGVADVELESAMGMLSDPVTAMGSDRSTDEPRVWPPGAPFPSSDQGAGRLDEAAESLRRQVEAAERVQDVRDREVQSEIERVRLHFLCERQQQLQQGQVQQQQQQLEQWREAEEASLGRRLLWHEVEAFEDANRQMRPGM